MRRAAPLALWMLAACGTKPVVCAGAAPSAMLVEGYCKNGEAADRCFFDAPPLDGF